MWVRVTKVGPRRLEGVLVNEPYAMPRLSSGHTLKFKRKHVIDISLYDSTDHEVVDVGHDGTVLMCDGCARQAGNHPALPPAPS